RRLRLSGLPRKAAPPMPTSLLVTLAAFVVAGLLLSGVALWLSCRLCRVRRQDVPPTGASLRRALLVVLLCTVFSTPLALAALFLPSPEQALLPAVAELVMVLLVLRIALVPSLGRSVLVLLLWNVLMVPVALGLVLALKTGVGQGFIIPTGALAETILGQHK